MRGAGLFGIHGPTAGPSASDLHSLTTPHQTIQSLPSRKAMRSALSMKLLDDSNPTSASPTMNAAVAQQSSKSDLRYFRTRHLTNPKAVWCVTSTMQSLSSSPVCSKRATRPIIIQRKGGSLCLSRYSKVCAEGCSCGTAHNHPHFCTLGGDL